MEIHRENWLKLEADAFQRQRRRVLQRGKSPRRLQIVREVVGDGHLPVFVLDASETAGRVKHDLVGVGRLALSQGTLDTILVHPREVFKSATRVSSGGCAALTVNYVLILRGTGRIPLQVIGETPEIADILLFGGGPVIFELDKVSELCDGWIRIVSHKAASVPVDAVTRSPPN